nr:PREDICTED: phthiocerol/phenolphthiocerol synthesis polyketide synthase type I PpsD-like [Lepisosteus oculatus]
MSAFKKRSTMEHTEEDLAIVGIGCNFPGGEGIENFWKVLLEGRNCAVEIPNERFSSKSWYDPDDSKAGKSRTAKAALIDGFNAFDHKFFGITEAEADRMDPQQKLLLECTYRALEDAGIPMEKASGTRTGVYIGLMNRDYEGLLSNSPTTINHYNGTGTAMSIAANRISYTFNFTGPSFAIDSACSSSLVALHSACQAIRQGDCEMAICGGVSCIIEPRVFVALSKAKMISPEGTSKPFSSKADGYGRGEGCGIVLLKPLQKAKRDFDHVWGIVSSTAVNQDCRSVTPITKPSMAQQQELLRTIYPAQIDPSHVQYVEAHGTGTEKWVETGPLGRAAGINNFGFGGTNAHAVVKQYRQQQDVRSRTNTAPKLFVLSTATEKSLKMMMEDTVQKISNDNTVDLQALAYTSACRRTHLRHKYRRAFVASSISNLVEQLKSATTKSISQSKSDPRLVFVFCGNGVTYRGMCKQLLQEECVFREKVKEIDEIFHNYRILNLLEKLDSDYDNDDYSKPDVVQPLLFAVQVAIASLFKHWGVKADAMVGHSVGEVAAAHCSGLLSLEDAVKVIYFRSALQATATGGKMLVVSNISVTEISKLLPAYSGKLCLAAYNSPRSCTLSGDADAIESIHQKLKTSFSGKNLFLHVLDVPAAYHSHMMDPILRPIEENIGMLTQQPMGVELFSTVTGNVCSPGDFITGEYWARNIREPVAFEQAVKSAAKDKRNVVFVEIGPRRALQRNILETLGNEATVFSSVQPEKDHEALLTVTSKLFELGLQVNWEQLFEGCETIPTPFPRYQFDSLKKEVYFELVRKGNETVSVSNHPVLMQTGNDDKEFSCNISGDSVSYISEHKNNGVVIVPGAFYVEMGLASFMASVRPKVTLRSMQLTIHFQSPFILSKNPLEMKVQLEPTGNATMFKVKSAVATYASGRIEHSTERTIKEKKILLDLIFKRCPLVVKSGDVYKKLSQVGFQYGSVFRNLGDVHYGEEFREALTSVKVPDETVNQLHDYCIHPVVLDYFLQMTAVVAANGFKARPGFPSAIGSLTVVKPLEEEMIMYLRTTKANSDYLEVCGCFTNKEGCVLVELKHVRITFLKNTSSVSEEYFFHNELTAISEDFNSSHRSVALVFADQLGVAQALRQHLHHSCTYIPFQDSGKFADRELPALISQLHVPGRQYKEVLFLWGIQNLNNLTTEEVLECLVCCCEVYRQIVKTMKEKKSPNVIRAVTYRSTENTVDHISPGFVLSGMIRSCAAEIPGLTFQLIDIGSVSSEDITALAQIINSHTGHRYPEVVISKGQIFTTEITRTAIKNVRKTQRKVLSSDPECFLLQTANPYKMTGLSASPSTDTEKPSMTQCVAVQMNTMCVHSSEYFPVSLSDLEFGQTIYWSEHASQNHKLLALDFSGKVTAVGSDVSKLKVGDHIVSCYPVVASSKVTIPEAVCYNTKKFPFLVEVPCLSFFILSWEILHCALPRLKQQRKLGIVCTAPESSLLQVLVLAANKSGWVAVVGTQFSGLLQNINRCDAFVFLPPFDADSVAKACSVSSAKHIIVVCDNQLSPAFSQKIFPSKNENVCIQLLQVFHVFQKAHLKKQKSKIYKWIKSLNLDKKSLDFHTLDESQSYFSCKTMPVVVLESAPKKNISDIPVLETEKQLFQQNSVYIVTGGLSGLGFETVKFIAERGGGCIAILSRSAPSAEKKIEITDLQNHFGVSVISLQCDVSVSEDVMKAITDIGQRFPSCPIRGVFHSAVVLRDGLIDILEKSHFEKVLRPKVNGVLNLHYATRYCKLDYFVCYSSITSFIGNSAQTNYAAANSFLDVFCHYRRNLGLSGQSINWGALNLGLLLNREHFQRFLEAKGMMIMEVPEIHECLEHCLLQNNAQQVVCKFSFKNLSNHVLSQNASLRMRLLALVTEELKNTRETEPQVEESTLASSADEYVKSLLCEVGNVDVVEMRSDTGLSALGIDSMLAMTLQNRIFQDRNVNVPLIKLLDPSTTVSSLVLVLQEDTERKFQNEDQKMTLSTTEKSRDYEFTQF